MLDSRRGLKVIVQPSVAEHGRSPAVNPRRYSIGVDFGTESARAVLIDVADGRECGVEVHDYRNGVIDARLPAPDDDVVLEPDWALQDPERLPGHVPTRRPPAGRSGRHRPRRGHRHRHRLHRLHDAPDDGRWHAAVLPRAVPARPACLGEAVEASRGTARGRRHQPGRRASSTNRGSIAMAAGSRPSGSSRRRSRSCARRPSSTAPPTAWSRRPTGSSGS